MLFAQFLRLLVSTCENRTTEDALFSLSLSLLLVGQCSCGIGNLVVDDDDNKSYTEYTNGMWKLRIYINKSQGSVSKASTLCWKLEWKIWSYRIP